MAEIAKSKTLPSWAVFVALSLLSGLISRSLWQHDKEIDAQRVLNRDIEYRLTIEEQNSKQYSKEMDELKRALRELPFEEIRLEMRSIKALIIGQDKRLSEIEFQLKTNKQ